MMTTVDHDAMVGGRAGGGGAGGVRVGIASARKMLDMGNLSASIRRKMLDTMGNLSASIRKSPRAVRTFAHSHFEVHLS